MLYGSDLRMRVIDLGAAIAFASETSVRLKKWFCMIDCKKVRRVESQWFYSNGGCQDENG